MDETAKPVRYNLELGADLYDALRDVADAEQRPVAEIVRRFIKLGLVVHRVYQTPDGAVILRENGRERELMLM